MYFSPRLDVPRPTRTRSTLTALLLTVCVAAPALLVSGCGGDEERDAATSAFEAKDANGSKQVETFMAAAAGFPKRQVALRQALEAEDLPKTRSIVAGMDTQLDRVDRRVGEIESPASRRAAADYTAGLRRLVKAFERLVLFAEGAPPQGAAAEADVSREIVAAGQAAQRQDNELLARIERGLPEKDAAAFRERMKRYRSNLEKQAGASPAP